MIGSTLGHYRILEKVGAGGMGEVYRARDEHLQRDVAIKILPPETMGDESSRKRFHKEALALAKLNHPNIETIFDFDTQSGSDFLVMEYIPGQTVIERLATNPLPERDIVRLGIQLAEGLAAAHEQGIVHRDLKPANLLITPEGRFKILDFGLAKLLHPDIATATTESSTCAVAGTLPYMAPEQLSGGAVDSRTDIYAFGNVIYEMATGRRPFPQSISAALISDILVKSPPAPGSLRSDLSPRLEEIILKCLEKDPENRYQSVKEILVDMRRSSSPSNGMLPVESRPAPRRRKLIIGAIAATLAAAAIVFLLIWQIGAGSRPVPMYGLFQVTRTEASESEPAISPDGEQIAYTSEESGHSEIYVIDIRGRNPIRLTNDRATDTSPAWFPDGRSIAFTSDREGTRAIWKIEPPSGGATLVVPDAEHPTASRSRFAAGLPPDARGSGWRRWTRPRTQRC
ncbi:MAG: protein kinase [Acidobacteriota bacterium]